MKNKQEISFIHAADLHLGPPLRGVKSFSDYSFEEWKTRLVNAPFKAFEQSIEEAISRKVDFFIISGDVFDTEDVEYGDYARFSQGLEKLNQENIEVYICTGNHDPMSSWKTDLVHFPKNTHFFEPEKISSFMFKDCQNQNNTCFLIGTSYLNKKWPSEKNPLTGNIKFINKINDANFSIGVLHTGLDIDLENASITKEELDKLGVDYWALGHIHKKHTWYEKHCTIAYPGCIQGLHINATGALDPATKGMYGVNYVTMSKTTEGQTKINIEFVSTTQVLWKTLKLDITNLHEVAEISKQVLQQIHNIRQETNCKYICLRIVLTGSTELHKYLINKATLQGIQSEINYIDKNCLCDEITDKTFSPYNYQKLLDNNLFPASVIITTMNFKDKKEKFLQDFQNIANKNKIDLPKDFLSNIKYEDLLEIAQNKVLDYLQGEN